MYRPANELNTPAPTEKKSRRLRKVLGFVLSSFVDSMSLFLAVVVREVEIASSCSFLRYNNPGKNVCAECDRASPQVAKKKNTRMSTL
mmetsp:Transcript_5534/g.11658  ORF Transcript_5534/g.11658 Transcript_5534/m.11658 type:complete len:88 (-) Transcript_5534:1293-1556(-)